MVARVLHVVDVLDRWAVETWLLRMLAHARTRGVPVDWSFYGGSGVRGSRDQQARDLGARVTISPVSLSNKRAFLLALRHEIIEGGYDTLHCHHDILSGVHLAASVGLPLNTRIVHVHNADESLPTPSLAKRLVLRPTLRQLCFGMSDHIVANSEHSLQTFLRGRRFDPKRHHVNYYGMDPGPFERASVDRAAFREKLGLAPETPILLFAGRVVPEKNPVFAVDVLAAIRRLLPSAVAAFAGDGSLEQAVRDRAAELGQSHAVHMLGWRGDIPDIMTACDWFILPHPEEHLEGFGMAVVEAQLAGLRILISNGVSDAPILPSAVWRRVPLDRGPDAWAAAALEMWYSAAPSRQTALQSFRASPLDMDYALKDLLDLYVPQRR